MTVTEVGGDEPEGVVDRLGVGVNENAAWVNAPGKHLIKCLSVQVRLMAYPYGSGAWLIHPVLILTAKVIIDALPSMTQPYSWTIVNLGYAAVSVIIHGVYLEMETNTACIHQVSYTMFHYVTGVPFESK